MQEIATSEVGSDEARIEATTKTDVGASTQLAAPPAGAELFPVKLVAGAEALVAVEGAAGSGREAAGTEAAGTEAAAAVEGSREGVDERIRLTAEEQHQLSVAAAWASSAATAAIERVERGVLGELDSMDVALVAARAAVAVAGADGSTPQEAQAASIAAVEALGRGDGFEGAMAAAQKTVDESRATAGAAAAEVRRLGAREEDAAYAQAAAQQAVADGHSQEAALAAGKAAALASAGGCSRDAAEAAGRQAAEGFDRVGGEGGVSIPGWSIDTWLSSLPFNAVIADAILSHLYTMDETGAIYGPRDSKLELSFLSKLGQAGSRSVVMSLLRSAPVLDRIADVIWEGVHTLAVEIEAERAAAEQAIRTPHYSQIHTNQPNMPIARTAPPGPLHVRSAPPRPPSLHPCSAFPCTAAGGDGGGAACSRGECRGSAQPIPQRGRLHPLVRRHASLLRRH